MLTAVQQNNFEAVIHFLRLGDDPNITDKDGDTPLHLTNNHNIAQAIIDHGANCNTVNSLGLTPLHIAAWNNNAQICQTLLDNGAQCDVKNSATNTPLHIAVYNGNAQICALLLEHGAKRDKQDDENRTP